MKLRFLSILSLLLTGPVGKAVAEPEPPPLPTTTPEALLTPLIAPLIVIVTLAILALKRPALALPFIGTSSSMTAGFLLGLAIGGMGLAMLGAVIGLSIAISVLAIGLTLKRR